MPRGGKREGSGRKPKHLMATVVIRKFTAEQILATVDERAKWVALLNCGEARVILDAMKYLTDRRDGKAGPAKPVADTYEGMEYGGITEGTQEEADMGTVN